MALSRPDLKNLAASRAARAACAVSLSLAVTAALAPLPAFAQTAPASAASSPAAFAPSTNPAGAQQPQPIEVEQGGDVKPEMGIVDLDKYEGSVVSWEDGKAVDTSKPGSLTKKAVVRYADNSMDVVEVPSR